MFAKEVAGLEAIIAKGHTFNSMVEAYHSITMSDALIAGDVFACVLTMDLTMKGPGRINMSEVCVYRVKDGKIISEQFFH